MSEEEKIAAEEAAKKEAEEKENGGNPTGEGDNKLKNVVEELKVKREESALYKKLYEDELARRTTESEKIPTEISAAVDAELRRRELSRANANKEAALARFIASNNVYSADNDPNGVKLTALKNKFAMFNTTGLVEVEDFISVIKDAHNLLVGVDKQPEPTKEVKNPYSISSPGKSNPDIGKNDSKLSEQERRLAQKIGYTEEKFNKLKERNPRFIEDLMVYHRD